MTSSKHLLVAIVATSVALAGCASTGTQLPERVLVPVAAECPVPEIPAQPTPPAALHDKSAPDAEKARALAVYIDQLTGHIDALTALLRGYLPSTHK